MRPLRSVKDGLELGLGGLDDRVRFVDFTDVRLGPGPIDDDVISRRPSLDRHDPRERARDFGPRRLDLSGEEPPPDIGRRGRHTHIIATRTAVLSQVQAIFWCALGPTETMPIGTPS